MKKHFFIILLLFAMPALLHSVTDEGISIVKLSMEPIPFNERRDPAVDSPYNAFDGDLKSAALYSDLTMEFSKPVAIDQIKIMNGNVSDKTLFKKQNRERDIEITLYTTAVKSDKKAVEKKKRPAAKKKVIKKLPEKKDNTDNKDKTLPDNKDEVKPAPDNEKKEEIKKPDTPEKVVYGDDLEIFNEYKSEGVKFFLTASDTVIEITDSKKDKMSNSDAIKKRIAEEAAKKNTIKDENENTAVQKELAGVDPSRKVEPDKPVEKTALPDVKKPVKIEKKIQKKVPVKKTPVKKIAKKTEKKTKKKTAAVKKIPAKKSVKSAVARPAVKKTEDKKITEKKPAVQRKAEIVKEVKKTEVKKDTAAEVKQGTKKEEKKTEEKKPPMESKKVIPPVIVEEKVVVKKMTGIVKIEDDKNGRVLVYASLKDSMEYQSINLKGEYVVTKIEFRTRDDEYYMGSEPDRYGITEIGFFNNGKRISFQGIDQSRKSYLERYNKTLSDSLSGQTFVILENNEIVLRAVFKRDGKIEFHDRFKCVKRGDPDCTSHAMPDAWRVEDGKLLMRYHTLWRVWKYELDSQIDMLDEKGEFYPPRWMKIYYKSDNGFTDKYLDLVRSDDGIRAE